MNNKTLYNKLKSHVGHDFKLVSYGGGFSLTLNCITCGCNTGAVTRPDIVLPNKGHECGAGGPEDCLDGINCPNYNVGYEDR